MPLAHALSVPLAHASSVPLARASSAPPQLYLALIELYSLGINTLYLRIGIQLVWHSYLPFLFLPGKLPPGQPTGWQMAHPSRAPAINKQGVDTSLARDTRPEQLDATARRRQLCAPLRSGALMALYAPMRGALMALSAPMRGALMALSASMRGALMALSAPMRGALMALSEQPDATARRGQLVQ